MSESIGLAQAIPKEESSSSVGRRLVAELTGTASLLIAVVGSGIMAERLAGGNAAVALLCNTVATGAALLALIITLGPISGAHFNPAVSLALATRGDLSWRDVPRYIAAQCTGAVVGVLVAHAMFGLPLLSLSQHARSGGAQLLSEFIATLGLVVVILVGSRCAPVRVPMGVAAWIVGAYWFTASTSFANPAVTVARSLSDTFAGIRPHDVVPFVLAELAGSGAALMLSSWMIGTSSLERDPSRSP